MKKKRKSGYYLYMENLSSYKQFSEPIKNILEIRLCQDTWEKIVRISNAKNSSYCWVVRYAVFRFIRRKNPGGYVLGKKDVTGFYRCTFGSDKSFALHQRALERRSNCNAKHRHRLCLYGEDEFLIKLVALRLGCSVTHLVRMALEKYLDHLFEFILSRPRFEALRSQHAFWYWLGIKTMIDVKFPIGALNKQQILFTRYQKSSYY